MNIAMNYLNAKVPFVLRNLADIDETSRKWEQAGYMEQLFGRKRNKHGQIINTTTSTIMGDDEEDMPMMPTMIMTAAALSPYSLCTSRPITSSCIGNLKTVKHMTTGILGHNRRKQ